MLLKLINNLTKNTIEFGELEDKLVSALFYSFDISVPDGVIDGEYTYELYDDEKKVSTGLLQVGDYKNEGNKEYNDNKKGYIVYE
jgi:hypothetical protein